MSKAFAAAPIPQHKSDRKGNQALPTTYATTTSLVRAGHHRSHRHDATDAKHNKDQQTRTTSAARANAAEVREVVTSRSKAPSIRSPPVSNAARPAPHTHGALHTRRPAPRWLAVGTSSTAAQTRPAALGKEPAQIRAPTAKISKERPAAATIPGQPGGALRRRQGEVEREKAATAAKVTPPERKATRGQFFPTTFS